MAGQNTLEITDSNFQAEVQESSLPVLMDFWATWCPPCKMLSPIIDELADEMVGKLKVGKVNTDESPNTRDSFRVSSIPTLVLMKNGQEVARMVGFLPKADILSKIQSYL